ncbi:MAG: N-acetylmuramoyl-L-alanine amidase-like domain-containing protein [Verrucomicrobiales bacterium]
MKQLSPWYLLCLMGGAMFTGLLSGGESGYPLPLGTTFKGEKKFQAIVEKARKENWREKPIGERLIACAMELRGTPYKGFTLEIDDHIESPSANLEGLDCWSFFEISLGLARMLESGGPDYQPQDLLNQILLTRYRGGICTGSYLERLHYLAEWFFDNSARGTIANVTGELGSTKRVNGRKLQEMTVLWKSYRYLRETPSLRLPMAALEKELSNLPVNYIPKSAVKSLESKLQNGDIIAIVTNQQGGFCSHVGLAVRTSDGVLRFMHASTHYHKVVIDDSLSEYLNKFKYHMGILVGRPLPASGTVSDPTIYSTRLKALLATESLVKP